MQTCSAFLEDTFSHYEKEQTFQQSCSTFLADKFSQSKKEMFHESIMMQPFMRSRDLHPKMQ